MEPFRQSIPQSLPESSDSGHSIKSIEQNVLSKLRRFRAYKICNGQCISVIGLRRQDQQAFINNEFSREIRNRSLSQWNVLRFACVGTTGLLQQVGWAISLNSALCVQNIESGQSLPMDERETQVFSVTTPDRIGNCIVQPVILPDPAGVNVGKQLIITNNNQGKHGKTYLELNCEARGNKLDRDVFIKQNDSVVLANQLNEKGQSVWTKIAERRVVSTSLETNPLVRNSGGICCETKDTAINYPFDGEYFLPLVSIQTLLHRKMEPFPEFNWACCDNEVSLTRYLRNAEQPVNRLEEGSNLTAHAVLETESHHSVAVWFTFKKDRVFCYCHDALGVDSPDALSLRTMVTHCLRNVFPESHITMTAPTEPFQRGLLQLCVFLRLRQ